MTNMHQGILLRMENKIAAYDEKPKSYYMGARKLFIDDLPVNANNRLLEVGCGTGDTCAYALATRKCGWCCGIELDEKAAVEAATKIHTVIQGDIEFITPDLPEQHFDILILSEVLEHLINPQLVLVKLRRYLKSGAYVRSGSPNIAHYRTIFMLLHGRWDLSAAGIMDSTHLRWFTPSSYRAMFEHCGYIVEQVLPARPLRPKARLFSYLTRGRWDYVLHSQIYLKAKCI